MNKMNAVQERESLTTQEVAQRFNTLAQQEKWFDIQDELFSDDVVSIEPPGNVHLPNAHGKKAVRKKVKTG